MVGMNGLCGDDGYLQASVSIIDMVNGSRPCVIWYDVMTMEGENIVAAAYYESLQHYFLLFCVSIDEGDCYCHYGVTREW
jgi:hypothetical protein